MNTTSEALMNRSVLESEFKNQFQHSLFESFFAPGRINLIGEHTDYNGGHVFPCAIAFGTYALGHKRTDRLVRLYSMNFPAKGIIEFSLDDLTFHLEHNWANYPKGMLKFLMEAGYVIESGVDVLFYGNIPNGAGLSSSASIELVTGVMLEELFQLKIDRVGLVTLGKKVENDFIGVNSGIMDQFAIGMGKAGYGILLDCQTLSYEYAPINLTNHKIIIMNTNKRRELVDSKYNERRKECEQALAELQKAVEIKALGELTEDDFQEYQHLITNETIKKRAKHAVYENRRTLAALTALNNDDLNRFGQLMNQSHISLRDAYEVTGHELDTLVEAAWQQDGIVGARMTGAGFGGCAIAIVENDHVNTFIKQVGAKYKEKIGYEATMYIATIGDGAKKC
jgi:galactokinase